MARPRTVADSAVLDAAARLIGRVGPRRLTLAHVAEECGLSPATLLQRFGSKRGLLLAVTRRPPDFGAIFAAPAPTRCEALVAALVALTASVRTPEAMANSLAFLQLDLADEEFRAEAVAYFAALRVHISALLEQAIAAGELEGVDAETLAETVLTAYNGALITWAVLRAGPLEDWLRSRVDAVLAPYRQSTRRPVSSVE